MEYKSYDYIQMTEQQVFDAFMDHIREQRVPSVADDERSGNRCVYRTEDGNQCGASIFLPDWIYEKEQVEGLSWCEVITKAVKYDKKYSRHRVLIEYLQAAHDVAAHNRGVGFIESVNREACSIASNYGLDFHMIESLDYWFNYQKTRNSPRYIGH